MPAWRVLQLDDYTLGPPGEYVGESRVVYRVHWECTETTDDGAHSALAYGSQSLEPFVGGEAFIAWSEVTEAQALEWLFAKAPPDLQEETEARVAARLDEQVHPTTRNGIPWEAGE